MKLLVVLSLLALVAAANSMRVFCNYDYDEEEGVYTCFAQMRTTQSDYTVDGVSGRHVLGKTDDDVMTIAFVNNSMERVPRDLRVWFKYFDTVEFINDQVLPNFTPDDMNDFEYKENHGMERFSARKLPMVTNIPKKTFWALNLDHLSLDEMPNMMNLDAELLTPLTGLRSFSARGPNKIDQISRGFFTTNVNLREVNFSDTRLAHISYSIFASSKGSLGMANFQNAGCLDKIYRGLAAKLSVLNKDIRSQCKDARDRRPSNIIQQVTDSSSSESDQSYRTKSY